MKRIILVSVVLLSACGSMTKNSNSCTVTPPQELKSERSAAVKAAADLAAYAEAPISANAGVDVKEVFQGTFQKVSDQNAACAMLLQTYACIKQAARAKEFQTYLQSQTACSGS